MTSTDHLSEALAGRYRVERELGAGGMATVYLAQDLKHDRRVALKVLRPELAAVIGAERFLAEIRTTANLQHPHILALFDSGQVDGTVFYVMPYVDGESLRDRLAREKQLPIDDALRIAREVGEALHYAHGQQVIHRDIKPENILLQGGHALVADFGIALAAAKTGGTRMTETGMSLGTPRYMSPEQAMGERELDARTDVYALGCVLYEMLTGDAPFTGSTAQAIVAKVLTERPPAIIPQRGRVPPHVEEAVLSALEKLPADRFATAAEFVHALTETGVTASRSATRSVGGRGRPASRQAVLVGGLLVAAVAGASGWLVGQGAAEPASAPPLRLALVEPGASIAFDGVRRTIDISRDGQTVVFLATRTNGFGVLERRLDGSASRELSSVSLGQLRLSPDARFLYAGQSASMSRLPLAGGVWSPVPGVEATPYMDFGDDGTIWWGSYLSSGTSRRSPDGRDSLVFPRTSIGQVLPGGRHALGVALTVGVNFGAAQFMDLRTGEVTPLLESPVVEVRYAGGYLIFIGTGNTLEAVPFDPKAGRVLGTPVTLATDMSVSTIGFAQWAVAENGTVVYIPGSESDLVRVQRDGRIDVLRESRRRYHSPRISPDGKRVAYDDVSTEGRDVWISTIGSDEVTRVTFQRDGHDPEWTHDGRGIHYLGARGARVDVYRTLPGTTVSAVAESMFVEVSHTGLPVKGDSTFLTTVEGRIGRGLDIVRLAPRSSRVDTVLATSADESYATPSPDGRWFAYTSDHSGTPELYVRSLSGGNVQLQVSRNGASEPVWARDQSEIFYRSGSRLVAAKLQLGAEPAVLSQTDLFDVSSFDAGAPHANYDVSPDGRWFVFARRGGANHIVVLQNVPEMARRLAAGGSAR